MTNTIHDFLETVRDNERTIVCPACGASMGAGLQKSYELMLTDMMRGHLNDCVQGLRRFIEGIEEELVRKKLSYSSGRLKSETSRPYAREEEAHLAGWTDESSEDHVTARQFRIRRGLYLETLSQLEAERIRLALDVHDFAENLTLPQPEFLQEKHASKALRNLVQEVVPSRFALVLEMILDQEEAISLQEKVMASSTEEIAADVFARRATLRGLVARTCPLYSRYLELLEEQFLDDDSVLDQILRIWMAIGILTGHHAADLSKEEKELFGPSLLQPGRAYNLPERTFVRSTRLVEDLLNCRTLFRGNQALPRELATKLLRSKIDPTEVDTTDGEANKNGAIWLDYLDRVFHFTCANSRIGTDVPCGWHPKEDPTHSVVLLGSQGVGKTSLMISGLTTLYNYIGTTGCCAKPQGHLARDELKSLFKSYEKGQVPDATLRGSRNRIEFVIERLDDPKEKAHFVFIDVAGEDVSSILTEEGASSDLSRVLRRSPTIVFLYDITLDYSFAPALIEADEENIWDGLKKCRKRVDDSRNRTAIIDQNNLLLEVVDLLAREKGRESLKDTRFICVLPKADVFADSAEPEHKFMTPFFQYLKDEKIIVKSPYSGEDEGFEGMCSLAGRRMDGEGTHLELCRAISNKAKESLLQIGEAFPKHTEEEYKAMFADKIREGLIQYVETRFGSENSYFFPISALGKDPIGESESGVDFKARISQKLSEYVFLLPILLALNGPSTR